MAPVRDPSAQRRLLPARRADGPRCRLRRARSRVAAPRGRTPAPGPPRQPHVDRRFGACCDVQRGRAPRPDDVARQRHERVRAARLGLAYRPTARRDRRLRRPLRARVEDRRAGDLDSLRTRPVRAGGDSRERPCGRGRHGEHRNAGSCPAPTRRRAAGARGPRRGVPARRGVRCAQRGPGGGGGAAVREPAQHRCRFAAPEGSRGHGVAGALAVVLPAGRGGRRAPRRSPRRSPATPRRWGGSVRSACR